MKRLLAILLLLPLAVSCKLTGHLERFVRMHDDKAVARVGSEYLYSSDIAKLLPDGISEDDSLRMSRDYIDSWALDKLIMHRAEKSLSKEEKDITSEVAEFRQNLLTFRYEKVYIEQRLDTIVSEAEAMAVYNDHRSDFVFPYSVIRGRVARISPKSPYYSEIKERFRASAPQDVADLEEICTSSAERYNDFSRQWVPSAAIAGELGIGLAEAESLLASQPMFEYRSATGNFIVYIEERTAPGQASPLGYNMDKIREMVISRRKQEILSSMQRELLEEASAGGKFKIYNRDE